MPDLSTIEKPNSRFLDRAGLSGFPWFTALALYTISYGWFWNVRNSYWVDDWWAFYYPGIPHWWLVLGFPKWIYLNKWLYGLIGPGFMRLIIFIVFFLSAICFYGILKKFKLLNDQYRKFATLLFLLLPFNSTRVTFMVYHYTTAYFYFFLAWYLIVTFSSLWVRILATSIFFISFMNHSLPVYFALPILHLFSLQKISEWRQIVVWVRENFFLILSAPTYWTLRWFFWNTTMTGLHNPSIPQLWLLTKILVLPGFIVLSILVVSRYRVLSDRQNMYLMAISIFAIFLGLAPYVAYGSFHGPNALRLGIGLMAGYWVYFLGDSNWQDRFLILQPLGVSLFICSLFYYFPQKFKKVQSSFQIFTLTFCVLFNLGIGFEFMVDDAKRNEVVAELQGVGYDSTFTQYAIIDNAKHLSVRGVVSTDWIYIVPNAYDLKPERLIVSDECVSSSDVRLVIIDGEESYWKVFQQWLDNRNFGFSVQIINGPTLCAADLVKNVPSRSQIPFLKYFTGVKN